MGQANITVVITAYNRASYIEHAIRSVLKQTYAKWKLLIMDDASSDDTVARVQPYLHDKRIRLITLEKNEGISRVLNRALKEVDTEAFVQLDSDDWLEKTALKRFVKAMKRNPKAALYYGNVRMWREGRDGKWKPFKNIRHRPFHSKYQFLVYMTYMLHPRCYRTEAVRKVGGWETDDPNEGRLMEDRRMVVKLIEKYRVHWIDQFLYNRRKHRNQLTHQDAIQARNQLRRQLVIRSLKRWGNHYKPVFGYRGGLLIIKRLMPRK